MTEASSSDAAEEALDRVLRDFSSQSAASSSIPNLALMTSLSELGFERALLSFEAGGAQLTIAETLRLCRRIGFYAAATPFAESIFANWLTSRACIENIAGNLTCAPATSSQLTLSDHGDGTWNIFGQLSEVPWARVAEQLVVVHSTKDTHLVVCVPRNALEVRLGSNLAGEPRDGVQISATVPMSRVGPSPISASQLEDINTAIRCQFIAGAIRRVLEMTTRYVSERTQFSRRLAEFQVVQHNIASLACECETATTAADIAAESVESRPNGWAIAAAKSRAGESATAAASISHQLHGAIGFTQEYPLHLFTKRLWSWRAECLGEAECRIRIGTELMAQSARGHLWQAITAIED